MEILKRFLTASLHRQQSHLHTQQGNGHCECALAQKSSQHSQAQTTSPQITALQPTPLVSGQQGFSVIEGLVAAAILSGIVFSSISVMYGFKRGQSGKNSVCLIHNQGILNKVKSFGLYNQVRQYFPTNGLPLGAPTTVVFNLPSRLGIPDALRWDGVVTPAINTPNIISVATPPVLNNSWLINSSINALLAVYNDSGAAGFCDGTARPSLGLAPNPPAPPAINGLTAGATTIRIRPYNTSTGAALAPPCGAGFAPLFISALPTDLGTTATKGPAARMVPPVAQLGGTTIPGAAAGNQDVGLLFTVITNFTDDNGAAANCTSEQRLQYETDQTRPPGPDFFSVTRTDSAANQVAGNNTNTYSVELGYSLNNLKKGSVLVCRDRSLLPDPSNPAQRAALPGVDAKQCKDIPGPIGTGTVLYNNIVGGNYPSNEFKPPGGITGMLYSAAQDVGGPWRSCDTVTACGVAPTAVISLSPGGVGFAQSAQPKMTLQYNNLPEYCRIRIEVAAIDPSTNATTNFDTSVAVTPSAVTPAIGGNMASLGPATWVTWDVNASVQRCTTWCSNSGAMSTGWPNGYWVNSGSCSFGGSTGACGTANGTTVSSAPPPAPVSGLCAAGVPSGVSWGTKGWVWTCSGTPTVASCTTTTSYVSSACFVAGTKVRMADGSEKNIEEVSVGEDVATFDETTGEVISRPVESVQHHEEKMDDLYTFTYGGQSVTSNGIHMYYLPEESIYRPAAELFLKWQRGEEIRLLDSANEMVKVEKIEKSRESQRLYNLHVVGRYDKESSERQRRWNHNYFANGVLVHNIKAKGCMDTNTCLCDAMTTCDTGAFYCSYGDISSCYFPTAADKATFDACFTAASPSCGGGAVNGACGSAHGMTLVAEPSDAAKCSAGTPTSTGGTYYSWQCVGSGGGTTASCNANTKYTASKPGGSGAICLPGGPYLSIAACDAAHSMIVHSCTPIEIESCM